jgi:hypothetical protein
VISHSDKSWIHGGSGIVKRGLYFAVSIFLVLLMQQCVITEVYLPMRGFQSATRQNKPATPSVYTYHEPIEVVGDDALSSLANIEMWPGNGSESDPYIIEGLNFTGNTYEFSITDVSLYVRITSCYFESHLQGTVQDLFCVGVYLNNCSSVKIDHTNFTEQHFGIRTYKSNNTQITENYFDDCDYGALIGASLNITFTSNRVLNSLIILSGCYFGNVTSNEFIGSGLGIDGQAVQEFIHTVEDNQVDGKPLGYLISISNMTLDVHDYGQLYLVNASRTTLENGFFNGQVGGISIIHSTYCLLRNINFTGSTERIMLVHSSNIALEHIRCSNGHYQGLFVSDCFNSTIHDSLFSGNANGIYIEDSFLTIVNSTRFLGNSYGIKCYDSASVLVVACDAENNGYGFSFYNTMTAVMLNNSILNNHQIGLYLGTGSAFCIVAYNYLGWNTGGNAYDAGTYNFWDDGMALGNFWSDYTVPPTYKIPGPANSVDEYPRVIIDLTPPTIHTTREPTIVNSSVPVSIHANVTDVSSIAEVILSYRVGEGSWNNISMEIENTNRYWSGLIPPVSNGLVVVFKVYAEDIYGNWGVSSIETYTVVDSASSTTETTNGTANSTTGTANSITGTADSQLIWMIPIFAAFGALTIIVALVFIKYRSRR